ncbi:MAG: type IV secretion system DNA-binding domain-containing protein [bacterium]|nr:type IV secretion system DNA-binding domain-containing protein [bacterium]
MTPRDDQGIIYFAETDSRNGRVPFGIKNIDRTRHVYVIGKTGMGKSTLLENMAVQDLEKGHGIGFLDPHGKTAELLLDYVPRERIKDVLYFSPEDLDRPISFNVMEEVGPDKRHLVVGGLMASFKKIWPDVWSARMEYILTNILLALLEYPGSTLLGVNRMLSDKDFRKRIVANISDVSVKAFWEEEWAGYSDRLASDAASAIQNKIGQFTANPFIRNIIGQPKSTFDMRAAMDEGKILIVNLSKGKIGEMNAQLLGSMLITKIYLSAMSRAQVSPTQLMNLPEFFLFVDEFQSFVSDSFADILSEARKYKLSLTIAHQYIEQMPELVRSAVFGNVGTTIAFRVGPFDAEILEKMFAPTFMALDVVALGFTQIYLSLMIDGVGSRPFSARSMPPIPPPEVSYKTQIIANSRMMYGRPREEVEQEIRDWFHEGRPLAKPPKPRQGSDALAPPRSQRPAPPKNYPLPRSTPAPSPAPERKIEERRAPSNNQTKKKEERDSRPKNFAKKEDVKKSERPANPVQEEKARIIAEETKNQSSLRDAIAEAMKAGAKKSNQGEGDESALSRPNHNEAKKAETNLAQDVSSARESSDREVSASELHEVINGK